jgi:Fe-S-cluster containining protein
LLGGVDDVPDELTEWIDDDGVEIHVMRQVNGACVALKGGRCSIYEWRPIECVEFERGGDMCVLIQ